MTTITNIKNYLYDNIIVRYKFNQMKKTDYILDKIIDNNSSKYLYFIKNNKDENFSSVKIRFKDYDNLTFI